MRVQLDLLKANSRSLAATAAKTRSDALAHFASLITNHQERLLSANANDCAAAKASESSLALLARLELTQQKIDVVRDGIMQLAKRSDPVGATLSSALLDEGLRLEKVSVPLGTIGVIFEARPDVMPQLVSLCLRSGNGIVLKGGKETLETNRAWMALIEELTRDIQELPNPWVMHIEGREAVDELLQSTTTLDLIIPRGSKELVEFVMQRSKIPVLGHADGVCHLYVDTSADIESALQILLDSKLQYPAACNSVETLLVAAAIAEPFLVRLAHEAKNRALKLKGCPKTLAYLSGIDPVADDDWSHEYGAPVLAIRVVDDVQHAISHINTYGSHHTDAIAGTDKAVLQHFLEGVDSASVMTNCSTRFADGYRYGFGAEVGISTSKVHARGPVGIEGLLTYQYRLRGTGQVVSSYVGDKAKKFKHS